MFPVHNLCLGHYICSYYLVDFDALADSDWSGSQVFHHDCNWLSPGSHFGVGIHDTQAMRQAGSIIPLQGLHHCMHACYPEDIDLSPAMYDLG